MKINYEMLFTTAEVIFDVKKIDKIYEHDSTLPEKWAYAVVDGYKTDYMVSTKGRVKNSSDMLLNQFSFDGRYWYVTLHIGPDKTSRLVGVHRLMGMTFIPIPNKYLNAGYDLNTLVINHKDGYKRHNVLYNLEWCTVKENMTHAIDHNLLGYLGEKSHLATINNQTAEKICKMIADGKNNEFISRRLGVEKKIIQHIRSRESWTHISKKYVFPKLSDVKPNTTDPAVIIRICELLQEKKYSDTEIGQMVGKQREYVKDIRTRRRNTKYSSKYVW